MPVADARNLRDEPHGSAGGLEAVSHSSSSHQLSLLEILFFRSKQTTTTPSKRWNLRNGTVLNSKKRSIHSRKPTSQSRTTKPCSPTIIVFNVAASSELSPAAKKKADEEVCSAPAVHILQLIVPHPHLRNGTYRYLPQEAGALRLVCPSPPNIFLTRSRMP